MEDEIQRWVVETQALCMQKRPLQVHPFATRQRERTGRNNVARTQTCEGGGESANWLKLHTVTACFHMWKWADGRVWMHDRTHSGSALISYSKAFTWCSSAAQNMPRVPPPPPTPTTQVFPTFSHFLIRLRAANSYQPSLRLFPPYSSSCLSPSPHPLFSC